jgi:hypothetical protein
MFIAWETAFRCRKQSCDLAAVGARAKQHGFTGRLLKALTLSYEQWFQQVVLRQGIITVQTMRIGRSRSHLQQSLLAQEACGHNQMIYLSTAQLREAS